MRFFTCFLSGWLLAAVLSAAETPEDDLQRAQEEIAAGKPQDAARTLDRLMKRPELNDAMRERVIRVQMDGHLLEAAATSAERLVKRSGQSPPKVAHQKLLEEVMTAHVKELDRILAMKTWADVGRVNTISPAACPV
ncbi:hypothetical protein [Verrucomicrobium spinosum]|uniref:hypothetical protein n=1 Tax=Verrucomicrobium spinosum TaxID=2736 RepID=UPI000946370F|nr:hypothetical protein [Verrucomicrobium spinosum]